MTNDWADDIVQACTKKAANYGQLATAFGVALRDERERCAKIVRQTCVNCNGTGVAGTGGSMSVVTREMALDAGQPERSGEIIDNTYPIECEYCGRQIAAIRNPESR